MAGLGVGVGVSAAMESAGLGRELAAGLGVTDASAIGLMSGNEPPGTRPGPWSPLSIRTSGDTFTMSPKAGTVAASKTATPSTARGPRESRRLGRRAFTISRAATPELINPGRTEAPRVAPAQAAMTPRSEEHTSELQS